MVSSRVAAIVAVVSYFSAISSWDVAVADDVVRPFKIALSQESIDDLRKRIRATRWPDRETVSDDSQGLQLAKLQSLAAYWADTYDWRKIEGQLNRLPQFMTRIDGVDIHFIHVKSKHAHAVPLLLTHGWPGSILEFVKVI